MVIYLNYFEVELLYFVVHNYYDFNGDVIKKFFFNFNFLIKEDVFNIFIKFLVKRKISFPFKDLFINLILCFNFEITNYFDKSYNLDYKCFKCFNLLLILF